ncbi:MAG: GNAT family N-acetyltransferase [Syntrophobacteraceae bacterium]|jgi:acyl-CoA hydrolase/GNAT superfamily N-acetyltransferase|nr:GNAT family N-acetyltransferase [Syntrophobacteraceae bacterium]
MIRKYWPDDYLMKRRSAKEAIGRIKPGQRVFIGTSCGEPQHLVKELAAQSSHFTDIEVVRLLSLETAPLTLLANEKSSNAFTIRSFYSGSGIPRALSANRRFFTPINLSAVPRLFMSHQIPVHVALIQVSPPDDFGWMSLGISVDVTLSAAQSADLVIAQVNPRMPRVLGRSFIHVDDVDVIVEHEEDLLTVGDVVELEAGKMIGRYVAKLVEDGSTLQLGLGATPQATLLAMEDKNDLGVHTEFLTDGLLGLISRGVITNRKKGVNEGKIVASSAIGTANLYEYLHDNPAIEFHPSDYVNSPMVIASHNNMVSLNVATVMDLTGQVAVDALPYNHFSGVTGVLDFVRGAAQSPGGKSVLMIVSTARDGSMSRIVPTLEDKAVVVPRSDVYYVVSEFGVVNLFGKSLQERAMAMISLAHPNFRDELFHRARELGLIGSDRSLKESIQAVYPLKYEETITIGDHKVTIRPAKPVDERRLQEHFYNLDKNDILSRFFHKKTSFIRDDVASMFQIDYTQEMTMVATIGELGFGRIIAVGGYVLDARRNLAEVAFSVTKDWKRRGLSKRILEKLAEAARDNGIEGLVAYTSLNNKAMIGLFRTLPYKVSLAAEDDMVDLVCRFDELP